MPPKGISCIENLFDAVILGKKLNGKTLSMEKDYDNKTEFSKFEFADQVILANFSTIDFSGFVPLLDRIVAVLKDYVKRC